MKRKLRIDVTRTGLFLQIKSLKAVIGFSAIGIIIMLGLLIIAIS